MNKFPRPIKPELIEIGDDIEITLPKTEGVIHKIRGVVSRREDHGNIRYLINDEGYIILAWAPGERTGVIVTLYSRKPVAQLSLFEPEFITEVRERIA